MLGLLIALILQQQPALGQQATYRSSAAQQQCVRTLTSLGYS